ncbi:hypothetical protein [Cohnella nanjingensis]|uniref:Uncharacterized protein n=1 Tax=Cohnella nanjingensis TaxID=1387779 RepID=A0A7X0RSM4_9BACL|nr:hypothetical protein [Cohnella nanjingensis]MBB6672974.1 hypothetical protein [Cohnella nanjingensis]
MQWLAEKAKEKGWNERVLDQWEYKAIYNERLLARVNERVKLLREGKLKAED